MSATDPYRLPRVATVRHYELRIAPDLDGGTFTGEVTIDLDVLAPSTSLWCNAIDLDIDRCELRVGSSSEPIPLTVVVEADDERLRLDHTEDIQSGPASLHLVYSGRLSNQLRGFYRSTFTDPDGQQQTLATTQFEATDARRAFPCWDEPEYKATFAITIDVAAGLTAVSNGPVVSETDLGHGITRVQFAPTMKMSTYLVAFVIGPLEITHPVDVDGIPVRVVHTAGNAHLTAFALESAAFALKWFAEYYGIAYPGEKLDLVAVPDFAFGAMENLGCVIFRETLLLVDPDVVPQPELQRVADVIHHEIAHMWFGDLVTMAWWNGIWLNEAFATFMEMKCTDAFRPEWQRWSDFGLSRSAAMDVDSLVNTRPIEYDVHSPADAEAMFDLLTYEKGAAVVRMLEQYVGEGPFRDGIRSYLRSHAYGSTETHDLWDAIETTTGEPVRQMMNSWIFQGGHPVVSVAAAGDAIQLTQQRFSYLDSARASWLVPVRLRASGVEHRAMLGDEPVTVAVREADVESSNVAGSGFYRVRLSPERLEAISAHGPGSDDPIERYGLVDDTWAMTLAGDLTTEQFLSFAEGFVSETDLSVWQRLIGALDGVARTLPLGHEHDLDDRLHALFAPCRQGLGTQAIAGESARTGELRAALLEADAVLAHDQDAMAFAAGFHASGDSDPALGAAAVRINATYGDGALYTTYVDQLANAASPQDRERYRLALPLFGGPDEMRRTIGLALDGTVRAQDVPFLVRAALRNRRQGMLAWELVTTQWDDVCVIVPSNLIARLLEGISALAEPDQATAVEAFLDAHPLPQGQTVIAQHRERLRVYAALRSRSRAQ